MYYCTIAGGSTIFDVHLYLVKFRDATNLEYSIDAPVFLKLLGCTGRVFFGKGKGLYPSPHRFGCCQVMFQEDSL